MKNNRIAAIDIGTNSIRCIVVEADRDGKFRVLDDEKATVRLGEGFGDSGAISSAAWERGLTALARMKKITEGYGVSLVEAVATSAVRRAVNGDHFVQAVARETGIGIEVISGDEEAELASLSALHNFDMDGVRYALADIGGGSVEIVTGFGAHVEEIHSLELGAVTLTEKFMAEDPPAEETLRRLRRYVRKNLRDALQSGEAMAQMIVGSGGTFTSVAAMTMAKRKEAFHSVHGYDVFRADVVHLLSMLRRRDIRGRKAVPGLNPDRADIILAGLVVVDELMRLFDVNVLRINERGIREGLILRALRKKGLIPEEKPPRSWRESVEEFARSCHNDDEHSRQVARLALTAFDSLAAEFGLGERDRQILEAAALLHDIGYFISYSSHHKHSYHLIRHADLFGFSPRERELVAIISRYHRRALPKKKHEGFSALAAGDQLLVRRLAGILRFADGLDRRRNSLVSGLTCSLSPFTFLLRLEGGDDLSVELFGARVKGDLFEAAFGRKLILQTAL